MGTESFFTLIKENKSFYSEEFTKDTEIFARMKGKSYILRQEEI